MKGAKSISSDLVSLENPYSDICLKFSNIQKNVQKKTLTEREK